MAASGPICCAPDAVPRITLTSPAVSTSSHSIAVTAEIPLPGSGISAATAMWWELVLTAGLVSVILGTASGAQQIGPLAAIGVGSYIALAGLWGSPVSGASMNPARSLGPVLVKGDWTAW